MNVINQEIPYCDPLQLFYLVQEQPWSLLLDSANAQDYFEGTNRYSYLCYAPSVTFGAETISLAEIQAQLDTGYFKSNSELPPFQGGAAGYIGYDGQPVMALYDGVISFDHLQKRAWVVACGVDAKHKLNAQLALVAQLQPLPKISNVILEASDVQANFTRECYKRAVQQAKDYILAGDIFEVNISQCFSAPLPTGLMPFDLYRRQRQINSAPFAGYFNYGAGVIASSSPERFLKLKEGQLEARPIKGTIARSDNPAEDSALASALSTSVKDRSENIMIVDLMRNDFSKICEPDSVKVEKLCGLESYANVHHLVSVIKGQLAAGKKAKDVIDATFPGGSITGAPKIRAMEIIDELEPTPRGPYCGSMGYLGFDGSLDLSILIRSFVIQDKQVTWQAGGAVTLHSDPEQEYQETLDKVSRLQRALTESVDCFVASSSQ